MTGFSRLDLLTLLRGQPALLLRFAVTSIGRTLLVMGTVLVMRAFLTAVAARDPGSGLPLASGVLASPAWLALCLIGSYVGASLFYYDNQVVRQRIVKHVELTLMDRLVRHVLTLSVGFFDRTSHGDLIHALRQDVADLRAVVLSGTTVVMETLVAAGLLAVAVSISGSLAFWTLLVLPLASLPLVMIARRMRARSFRERKTAYTIFDSVLQIVRGIRVLRIYRGEPAEAASTLAAARRHFDEQIRMVRIRELSTVVLESLAGLSVAAVIIVGGLEVMAGTLAWAQLVAFLMAVRMLHGPLDHISSELIMMQRHGAAIHRIAALLRERPAVSEAVGAAPFAGPPYRVVLEGVSFAYGERPVLEGVSVEVRAGETLGIAGPSGSGKTTLLGLLARFHDPTVGTVRCDDRDLRGLRLDDLYRQLAFVGQEPFLFATTVRENIRCGRPEASDAEVEEAARHADVHDEILALRRGYDTVVGIGGQALSGGQAQRINVARAIIKNAPILLLDEATSHLDSLSELTVQRAIDRLQAGRTSFVVAHRLSTLRHADRILVLDHGRCVGLGPHDALLQDCPLYRRMWEAQRPASAAAPRPSPPRAATAPTALKRT